MVQLKKQSSKQKHFVIAADLASAVNITLQLAWLNIGTSGNRAASAEKRGKRAVAELY